MARSGEGRRNDKGDMVSKGPEVGLGTWEVFSQVCLAEAGLCAQGEQSAGQPPSWPSFLWVDCHECPRPVLCPLHGSWCLPLQARGPWGLHSLG